MILICIIYQFYLSIFPYTHQIITQNLVPQLKPNRKKTPEDLGEEEGVIGVADDAKEDHQVASSSLTSYKT
jgi:hypothetical protein